MKFCKICGNELLDEAEVCMNCGCAVSPEDTKEVTEEKNKKDNIKKIILIVVAVISALALLVGGYFLVNYIRAENVIKDLSGKKFSYFDSTSYPSLGIYYYETQDMEFDKDGEMTYSYYYSSIDAGNEYQRDYKIKFKNKMTILDSLGKEYEIQYDRYGAIESIYDISAKEKFERK